MIAWLVFGMLAANEVNGLAAQPGHGPALAIFYGAAGLAGIGMMVRRAIRRARPSHLYLPLGVSLLGIALVTWLLRKHDIPPAWAGTFVLTAGFLALSSCAVSVGAIFAWRRRGAARDRHSRVVRDSERQRLLERDLSSPVHQLVAELENPPIEAEADLLAPRLPRSRGARRRA